MNQDYSYCKGNNCTKKKQRKRFLGNHILEFLPRLTIQDASCIRNKHSMFDEKDKK